METICRLIVGVLLIGAAAAFVLCAGALIGGTIWGMLWIPYRLLCNRSDRRSRQSFEERRRELGY